MLSSTLYFIKSTFLPQKNFFFTFSMFRKTNYVAINKNKTINSYTSDFRWYFDISSSFVPKFSLIVWFVITCGHFFLGIVRIYFNHTRFEIHVHRNASTLRDITEPFGSTAVEKKNQSTNWIFPVLFQITTFKLSVVFRVSFCP